MQTQLETFIARLKADFLIDFRDTLNVITEYYEYHPTRFFNGLREDRLVNEAGTNEGSCKIFYFARLHGLTESQTLNLFGNYYRDDVLNNPDGQDHLNIRTFMRYGWEGVIHEEGDTPCLVRRSPNIQPEEVVS